MSCRKGRNRKAAEPEARARRRRREKLGDRKAYFPGGGGGGGGGRGGGGAGMEPLRVLELYSGVGGMHQALRESGIPAHVVAAIDVNDVANEVYKYNFPQTQLLAKTIEGITLEEFDRLSFNMILMSPPCQPFTRIGLQGDVTDPRTNSFLYILNILPRLQALPKYILLENVKGFEVSSASLAFQIQGYGISLLQSFRQSHYLFKPLVSYGRYIEGTGSVLQTAEDVQIENIYKSLTNLSQEEKITKLLMLKLRYFTPKEIANLLGFPPEFGFPENITVKQRYRLLGNSLNVHVVAKLIKVLYG
ncbi:tRNA (cytosine(38)-C(5))-methyltransferase isoform X5 [Pipistrellus kuhlii]|uniref:tRNA (cytosine(38)-C(5))-methyltransferase isoform X5 n=1 Tax=Pipistrellus kuhlii TaxID=59472 RepID=UPI001E271D4E|nr:tRNA (cytosine(38)-C(5))-methyltransferase isoform X5 [Pipistrellus kuhlii]